MTWTLEARNGRTQLQIVYNVGGYIKGGFTQLAPVVERCAHETQVRRLKTVRRNRERPNRHRDSSP